MKSDNKQNEFIYTMLIGDENGLDVLIESLAQNKRIKIAGIIYNDKRPAAKQFANELYHKGFKIYAQPKYSETEKYHQFIEKIKALKADIAVCYSYDRILRSEILSIFPEGIYNLHGALLPQYRGGNALNWVLINGEKETGMTLHLMEESVDTGPIVLQKRVLIQSDDTAVTLSIKLKKAAQSILPKFWKMVEDKQVVSFKQDDSKASYYPKRNPDDGEFNWNQKPERIYNLIRGLVKPWPGAFYYENGKKHIIDWYIPYDEVVKKRNLFLHQ